MTIGSLMSRMGTAEKLSIPQIQQAIKNGTLPAYVGIPMLQEKMKQEQAMRSAQQQAQQSQPSIAEQVMAQAQAEAPQGIPQLASNLPAQGMAEGGIVAFARGGSYDDELDDEEQDAADLEMATGAMDDAAISRAIMSRSNAQKPAYSSLTNAIPESIRAIPAGIGSLVQQVKEKFSPAQEPVSATAPVKSSFQNALNFVLPHEGGYANIKQDRGGPTKFGVTKNTLEGYLGKKVSEDDVENMDIDLAKKIYKEKFWDAIDGDKLDPKIAMLAFDTAVGSGVGKAKEMLSKYGDDPAQFLAAKKQWMKDIVKRDPSQKIFDKGWQNRMNNLGDYIQNMPTTGIAGLAEGGSVKHFQLGGLSAVDLMNSSLADVKRMAQMGEAGAADELLRRQKNMGIGPPRMAGSPSMSYAAPAAQTAAVAETPGVLRGIGSLLSRSTVPLMMGSAGYGITNAIMEQKQADELAKYGKEPELTEEEIARASKPAFMRDVSMSPKEQKERNIKPLAPLTYTPAGVETYGSRPGYTPPSKVDPALLDQEDLNRGEGMRQILKESDQAAFDKKIQELQDQPMKADQAVTGATKEKTPSSMDEYLKMLKEGYADVKKQTEEDKYLALLAAGLGMMGGTSPYAGANIGAGAMQGVASLASARKDRAAEKNALDRAYGQALYRQSLGENTAAYKTADLDIRRDTLALNQKKELDSVLNNIQTQAAKRALAALKMQGINEMNTEGAALTAKIADWVDQDLARNKGYQQVYKERWGLDYDVPTTGGGASYAGFKRLQ